MCRQSSLAPSGPDVLRTAFISSHSVVEVSPLPAVVVADAISQRGRGFRPNVWLHWLDADGNDQHQWGEVTEADYGEMSNPDSLWYRPGQPDVRFRFTYADGEGEPVALPDPDDPLHIPW